MVHVTHRVEMVRYAIDNLHESWTSPDGSVALLRDRDTATWRAVVDRVQVIDPDILNGTEGALRMEPQGPEDALMTAGSARALAARLALQEHLHLIFVE